MPAPIGSANAIKHGVRRFLSTGKLPEGCGAIGKALSRLRRELNTAIDALRSRGIADDLAVQSIMRTEGIALLWMRWLADQGDKLPVEQRLAITKEIRAATADRDRAVAGLKLGGVQDGPKTLEIMFREAQADAADHD